MSSFQMALRGKNIGNIIGRGSPVRAPPSEMRRQRMGRYRLIS